jgi:hypothetical protein
MIQKDGKWLAASARPVKYPTQEELASAQSVVSRALQLSQARQTLNDARLLDAASDQWALENGIANGAVDLKGIAVYFKLGSRLRQALEEGKVPTDARGNPFILGEVGPKQIQINLVTKKALALVTDWSNY